VTLTEAREALTTALASVVTVTRDPAGLASPPAAIVYGDGVDTAHIGRGQSVASFRILLVAGAWDGTGAADALAELVNAVLTVLRAMVGWQVGELGRDSAVNVSGSTLLGCDVRASVMIEI